MHATNQQLICWHLLLKCCEILKLIDCPNLCLPDEVIEKILLLLPAKSTGRVRSVSKQLLALLSSPRFIKAHASIVRTLSLEAQSVSIFTLGACLRFSLTNNNQVTAYGVHHNLHFSDCFIVRASCDGLVLVLDDKPQTFLVNPTTGHTREIPTVFTHRTLDSNITWRTTMDGIGFDSITNDYKVVSISHIKYHQEATHQVFVLIYSVNNGAWKSYITLPKMSGYHFDAPRERGVFLGRCIHWVVIQDSKPVIVAFDVVEEKLCEVPTPTHHSFRPTAIHHFYSFGVVAGCLYASILNKGHLNVWVMNEYGIQESWTRIARIKVVLENCWFVPFCWVGQQNLVLLQYYNYQKLEKLVTYNVAEKMFQDIDIPDGMKDDDIKDDPYYANLIIPFAETMVSPYG